MAKQINEKAVKYSKEQILTSKRYKNRIDVANSVLFEHKEYTHADVDAAIEKYLKGKVN